MCDPQEIFHWLLECADRYGWSDLELLNGSGVIRFKTLDNGPEVTVAIRSDNGVPLRVSIFPHFKKTECFLWLSELTPLVQDTDNRGWCLSFTLKQEDMLTPAIISGLALMQILKLHHHKTREEFLEAVGGLFTDDSE